MIKANTSITLGSLAFCLYRSAAAYLYSSSMGIVDTEAGFISNTTFVFAVNLCTCLTAFLLLCAIRSKIIRRTYPLQWIGCLAVIGGFIFESSSSVIDIPFNFQLMIIAILCGFSLMMFCAAWMEFFVAQNDGETVLAQIVLGYTAYSIVDGFWTKLSPNLDALVCTAFLLLSSLIITIVGNRKQRDCCWPSFRISLIQKFSWFISICFFILVCVVGIMHTSVIGSSSELIMAKVPMWLTRIVSTLLLIIIVMKRGQKNDPSIIFKLVFSTLIFIITLMPFLGESYATLTSSVAITGYQVCAMTYFLFQLGEGRRLGLPSYLLSCVYMLGSSGFLLLGLSTGIGLQSLSTYFNLSLITLLSFSVIYPLAFIAIILFFRDHQKSRYKLVPVPHGYTSVTASLHMNTSFSIAVSALAQRYNLTNREREILQYLVCGRTVKYIANFLVISENTVWTHAKRIYSKTNTHGKQELMTVLEQEIELLNN